MSGTNFILLFLTHPSLFYPDIDISNSMRHKKEEACIYIQLYNYIGNNNNNWIQRWIFAFNRVNLLFPKKDSVILSKIVLVLVFPYGFHILKIIHEDPINNTGVLHVWYVHL